jgi:FkbM family methyltransferase
MTILQTLRSFAQDRLPTPVLEGARLVRQRFVLAKFHPYTATHLFGGRELTVHINDETARAWYDGDWKVPAEIEVIATRGQLRPGATVFNIGAHHAIVAMILAEQVGDSGRVVAVEALPHNAATARANIATNGVRNVSVVHAAGSDTPGTLRFTPLLNGYVSTGHAPGVEVPAVTVDQLAVEYGLPDVLFMDVEGYEMHVLRGAAKTIHDARPDICVEVHSGGVGLEQFGTVDELLALIPDDYTILVAPPDVEPFVPLAEGRTILDHRARLIALAPPDSSRATFRRNTA